MAKTVSKPQAPRPAPKPTTIVTHGSPNDSGSRPKK